MNYMEESKNKKQDIVPDLLQSINLITLYLCLGMTYAILDINSKEAIQLRNDIK